MRKAECGVRNNRGKRAVEYSAVFTSHSHSNWWEVLVTLESSLPTFVLRHRIYRPAAGTPPQRIYDLRFTTWLVPVVSRYSMIGAENGSGGGNHTHLKEFMRLLSVL